MSLLKSLDELVAAGVISPDTADNIRTYYSDKEGHKGNRLMVIFGVLGGLLVGLGIVLIVAYNWEYLSRPLKTALAFLLPLIGQGLCGFTLFKHRHSQAWREGTSTFLVFALGAGLAIISQVYNLSGSLSSFMLTWIVLCLPIIYVMASSMASLLALAGITWYACASGYWEPEAKESMIYWVLLAAVIPHYYLLIKNHPQSNFTAFHHWLIPLSLVICLGIVAKDHSEWMYIAYMSLFGVFLSVSQSFQMKSFAGRFNGYEVLGKLGILVILIILSFDWFWKELIQKDAPFSALFSAPEFYLSLLLTTAAVLIHFVFRQEVNLKTISPFDWAFIIFIPVFIVGYFSPISVILINIILFVLGVWITRMGAISNHLGTLNLGLLILTALIISRFFDTNVPFSIRGILFVLVGAGFVFANYRMLKKSKNG